MLGLDIHIFCLHQYIFMPKIQVLLLFGFFHIKSILLLLSIFITFSNIIGFEGLLLDFSIICSFTFSFDFDLSLQVSNISGAIFPSSLTGKKTFLSLIGTPLSNSLISVHFTLQENVDSSSTLEKKSKSKSIVLDLALLVVHFIVYLGGLYTYLVHIGSMVHSQSESTQCS